ncbi:1-(5-phosphoribosyl)-5-[(5-phosphoribosylamino)methylideneamino] imidazole-4-carboxamide isomerase [Frankliniella fusca]|uniref:1-(5-phosphoribosyl)-5-[(5-phosphoribosylamino)methylideneamino] imidazole-4-carboxamide isomerase n=1 Tax=Frankliniella fusca TaxID=407009 RepID=A0AAE1HFE8_9NEOP|nr:1-(5-phosphoribosyl)-5-[(5-phosphoribosylamino)methylideneamino] imidazole-4-carboxamide isomerase [Frankliniella fusca]
MSSRLSYKHIKHTSLGAEIGFLIGCGLLDVDVDVLFAAVPLVETDVLEAVLLAVLDTVVRVAEINLFVDSFVCLSIGFDGGIFALNVDFAEVIEEAVAGRGLAATPVTEDGFSFASETVEAGLGLGAAVVRGAFFAGTERAAAVPDGAFEAGAVLALDPMGLVEVAVPAGAVTGLVGGLERGFAAADFGASPLVRGFLSPGIRGWNCELTSSTCWENISSCSCGIESSCLQPPLPTGSKLNASLSNGVDCADIWLWGEISLEASIILSKPEFEYNTASFKGSDDSIADRP